jgi:hypothetical protein
LIEPLPRLGLFQPEIGTAVDHQSVRMQLRSHLTRSAVRQSQEHHIMIIELLG